MKYCIYSHKTRDGVTGNQFDRNPKLVDYIYVDGLLMMTDIEVEVKLKSRNHQF